MYLNTKIFEDNPPRPTSIRVWLLEEIPTQRIWRLRSINAYKNLIKNLIFKKNNFAFSRKWQNSTSWEVWDAVLTFAFRKVEVNLKILPALWVVNTTASIRYWTPENFFRNLRKGRAGSLMASQAVNLIHFLNFQLCCNCLKKNFFFFETWKRNKSACFFLNSKIPYGKLGNDFWLL